MPTTLTALERQDLRHAVLYALARRPNTPMTPAQVKQSVTRLLPFDIDIPDVLAAITFHVDLQHVKLTLDEWGAEDTYQITAQGSLAYDRDPNKTA